MAGHATLGSTGSAPQVATGLFFPDWIKDNTCKLDEGDAPAYMVANPGGWMVSTLEECCSLWYSWRKDDCVGNAPAGSGGGAAPGPSPTSGLYYPNWLQGTNECVNDGNQPQYMTNNPNAYMFSTLDECCKQYYSWTLDTCSGTAGTGTLKWYVDWSRGADGACVTDCPTSGGGTCAGLAMPWDLLWDSKSACCTGRKWWDDDCMTTT